MITKLIKDVRIVDGANTYDSVMNIGIDDNRICYIGRNSIDASEIIDANGLYASSGWIDSHSHTDVYAEIVPDAGGKILQGVTTDISGLCSTSAAPISRENLNVIQDLRGSSYPTDIESPLRPLSFADYVNIINRQKNATNMAMFVGNANLRIAAAGVDKRSLSNQELQLMKTYLRGAMEEGALGLSSGLNYVPSMFADEKELIELCKVLPTFNGMYNSHMRNEGDLVIESVKEVINIARESGCRGHISHLKCVGKSNHGKSEIILKLIEDANDEGIQVTFDIYPYTAGSISLSALLPDWVLSEKSNSSFEQMYCQFKERIMVDFASRDWDNILLNVGPSNIVISAASGLPYEGKTIEEISRSEGLSSEEVIFRVLEETKGGATIVFHSMAETDLINFLSSKYSVVGSDAYARKYSGFTAIGKPHPRNYGTFPRFIQRYVIEKKILTLDQAINKLTSRPANLFGLRDRGELSVGQLADIVIFDLDSLKEEGTFQYPVKQPSGIRHVMINGGWAVRDGKQTDSQFGTFIQRNK